MRKIKYLLTFLFIFSSLMPMSGYAKTTKMDFLKDKTKIYTYKMAYRGVISYQYLGADLWIRVGNEDEYYTETQNKDYYNPESDAPIPRKVKKGYKKYILKSDSGIPRKTLAYTIVSTNSTVKTRYKTFKNAVIIKEQTEEGFIKDYYVSHYGCVKSIDQNGTVWRELMKITKNKSKL